MGNTSYLDNNEFFLNKTLENIIFIEISNNLMCVLKEHG